ncbi:hypothetical protein [Actinomadura viridis]|uniref:Uncharacterized protein n=1 Tax=Actinomadura viridis TaxID=58110 RepID=A0A931DT57_9ACTN|nr:hypothetical protein [Actinomadura viridis]MBG6093030.1 hypothetical protein [Actinomadura viridis]
MDGTEAEVVHRSVLDEVAGIARGLGCRSAAELDCLPASFTGDRVARLRRDLDEVIAFATAAQRTGWVLGDLAVAPRDHPVPVLDTPQGRLWAHPLRGFELHREGRAQRVTELDGVPGTARRTALPVLIAPLATLVARARLVEAYERGH